MNPLLRSLFRLAGGLSRAGSDAYRRDYDQRAATYDSVETRPPLKRVTAEFVSELGLRPGLRCLDLGCGTGYSSLLLDRAVRPSGRVDGCDNSAGMLSEAEKLLAGDLAATSFTRADMLEFLEGRPAGSADLIASFWAAEYCPPGRLLGLAGRALAKGGAAALLINTAESLPELQGAVLRTLLRHPGCLSCVPPINFPPDMAGLRRGAERAGFAVERLDPCSLTHSFSGTAAALNWLRGGGPAAGLTAALKPERAEDFFSAFGEEVERRNGLTVTFKYLKFVGRKK